jgi:hypothetical protein
MMGQPGGHHGMMLERASLKEKGSHWECLTQSQARRSTAWRQGFVTPPRAREQPRLGTQR